MRPHCLGGKLGIVSHILDKSEENMDGKLPIELLLYDADCDHSSMEFMNAVKRLFKTNPAITLANLSPGLFARGE